MKCDNCEKKLENGDDAFQDKNSDAIYCSKECVIKAHTYEVLIA